jgi:hypothetical protein
VKLTALELIPTPDELRRDDGRSVYEPHDGDRFATKRQLALEERLIAAARETDALRISPERAEELVNASPLAGSKQTQSRQFSAQASALKWRSAMPVQARASQWRSSPRCGKPRRVAR